MLFGLFFFQKFYNIWIIFFFIFLYNSIYSMTKFYYIIIKNFSVFFLICAQLVYHNIRTVIVTRYYMSMYIKSILFWDCKTIKWIRIIFIFYFNILIFSMIYWFIKSNNMFWYFCCYFIYKSIKYNLKWIYVFFFVK